MSRTLRRRAAAISVSISAVLAAFAAAELVTGHGSGRLVSVLITGLVSVICGTLYLHSTGRR